ncbi:putative multidrug ABC transporter ATP-binding protein YbhF [Paenibacillus plantiphilus]|uniref:Multidrug ABC transporter ATP-binding protein YbhF n=1 Tax=Paenibacillus plantiphilus TaxID=2905650 RepID=A0ABM9CE83_9BACL|nr:ABC transporter ATP-binding protein [Paenibacillus plantiphilus]CAH1210112.1 putative multidrug ABC transporter ATP-binding protein YbhF [Paenibacillus plantiphilus]
MNPTLSTSSQTVIALKGIVRQFGSRIVLDNITLNIERGELFGLLGPSGSGKTTMVKLITGIDSADSGTVHMLGQRMPKLSMLQRFGYMSQSDALYNDLTAKQNLAFFAALYGLNGKQASERINHAMAIVRLLPDLDKPVAAYSGGMKRRLSLAIALLHEPELLVLDEPTVGIDPVLRQSIWKELGAMRERGTTILLTTHVMDEAEKCDRLALIRGGKLTAVDTPEALKVSSGSGTIEEAFIKLGGGE